MLENSGELQKILIVRLGALGDVVNTIPAQQRLKDHFPAAQIHWLVEPHYAPLLLQTPGISRIWRADTKRWRTGIRPLGAVCSLIRSLRAEKFDLAIDFQGLAKSALLAFSSGAHRRLGFARGQTRERSATLFYTDFVQPRPDPKHMIEKHLDLLRPFGCSLEASLPVPLHIPDEVEAYVEKRLSEVSVHNPVLLNPGAGWPTKQWDASKFGRLARRIEEELNLPVLFTIGPGEEGLLHKAQESAQTSFRWFPTTILQFAALCRRSRLLVAGDTGPLHLAVAQGLPCVALMGPTWGWRNGPFHAEDRIVRHSENCRNPYKKKCSRHFCMDFSVEQVFDAVTERLQSARSSG